MQRYPLGKCIRDLRKSKGVKATFIADKIGISYSGLWKIENGMQTVRADHLHLIASILGVSVDYFFDSQLDKNASEVENHEAAI